MILDRVSVFGRHGGIHELVARKNVSEMSSIATNSSRCPESSLLSGVIRRYASPAPRWTQTVLSDSFAAVRHWPGVRLDLCLDANEVVNNLSAVKGRFAAISQPTGETRDEQPICGKALTYPSPRHPTGDSQRSLSEKPLPGID